MRIVGATKMRIRHIILVVLMSTLSTTVFADESLALFGAKLTHKKLDSKGFLPGEELLINAKVMSYIAYCHVGWAKRSGPIKTYDFVGFAAYAA